MSRNTGTKAHASAKAQKPTASRPAPAIKHKGRFPALVAMTPAKDKGAVLELGSGGGSDDEFEKF